MKCLLRFVYAVGIAILASQYLAAGAMQFGSPGNHFSIDFELIESPNNSPDNTGSPNPAGSVSYKYQMGTFEVSRFLIIKYNVMYGHANDLEITMENMGTLGGNGANQPATGISWNEAARFANWLNEITGNAAAYKFNGNRMSDDIALWTPSDTLDYNPLNPYRSKRTLFALPTANEWYKAAYFNPTVTGGGYWDYPQGSNTAPTPVSSSVAPGTAVYDQPLRGGPSKVDEAGGLSSNGMMGMGGNVWEWQETAFDSINDDPIKNRAYRGGSWIDPL
ncbi:MAG: formylglycine-generating enzyme family protein, partial [Pirellula sp.]